MKKTIVLCLFTLAVVLCGNTRSDVYVETVSFGQAYPIALSGNQSVVGKVDFKKTFSKIKQMCIVSHFTGDLADTDEGLFFGPFGSKTFGWVNVKNTATKSEQVCLNARNEQTQHFLDGVEEFAVQMEGSAHLSHLSIVIEGVAVESIASEMKTETQRQPQDVAAF